MPRTLRGRVILAVAATGLLATIGLTIGFNVLLRSSLATDADRVLAARGAAALQEVSVRNGQVTARESADEAAPDAGVWIYQATKSIERQIAPAVVDRLADQLAKTHAKNAESPQEDLRLSALPISDGSRRAGTVVVALSVEPYERSASRALAGSLIFAAFMLLMLIVAARIVMARALRPVAEMTAEAADWSEHDLDHRFNLGEPNDELTHLAATFDSMLARLAANLRHEQRLTAEISHELRTPLAAISAETELALRKSRDDEAYREALRSIQRRAAQLTRALDALLAVARGDAASEKAAPANQIAEVAIAHAAHSGPIDLRLAEDDPVVSVGTSAGVQILAPLIDNATRYGHGHLEIRVARRDGKALISVVDDGPGIRPEEVAQIFDPGARGSAAHSNGDGSGLGLTLSRRLASAVGGDVAAVPSSSGGRFEVTLPLAPGGETSAE
jgi:two-component system, OmpR family, sensor kinase